MKRLSIVLSVVLLASASSWALATVPVVDGSDLPEQSTAQSDQSSTTSDATVPDADPSTADNTSVINNNDNATADNNADVDDVYAENANANQSATTSANANTKTAASKNTATAVNVATPTDPAANADSAAVVDHVIPAGSPTTSNQTSAATTFPASAQTVAVNNTQRKTYRAARDVAPVVDTSSLSVEQRLARVEAALAALQNDHVLEQVATMQQQVQALQGQLDVVQHQQTAMQTEQRTVYQSLDQRISNTQSAAVTAASATPALATKSQAVVKSSANGAASVDDQTNKTPIGQAKVSVKEQDAYQNAFNTIKEKKYPEAITAMESYLQTYPDGRYALNAEYWLGELYLLSGDENTASDHFTKVITQDAHAPKAADAMLKLGMIAADNNQPDVAKQRYQKVIDQYPTSTSARVAQQNLRKITQSVG